MCQEESEASGMLLKVLKFVGTSTTPGGRLPAPASCAMVRGTEQKKVFAASFQKGRGIIDSRYAFPLICPTDKVCRPNENNHPSNQEKNHIECQPKDSGSPRKNVLSTYPPEEKHIDEIRSRKGAEVEAQHHTHDPIHHAGTGNRGFVVDQTGIGNPGQDQEP